MQEAVSRRWACCPNSVLATLINPRGYVTLNNSKISKNRVDEADSQYWEECYGCANAQILSKPVRISSIIFGTLSMFEGSASGSDIS